MRSNYALKRWLMQEVHGIDIGRKPPRKASKLHTQPFRSYPYRRWIASLPSAVSGLSPCDPCHTGPHSFGAKASDLTCIPLTRSEHEAYDANPQEFSKKHDLDVPHLVKRLNRIWFEGRKQGA